MAQGNKRTGGRVLVGPLGIHGADTVFHAPGENRLAAPEALYGTRDAIAAIACRHEAGPANMAQALGKPTGRPGVLMVIRGPAPATPRWGRHTTARDSTPVVTFTGQAGRGHSDRGALRVAPVEPRIGPGPITASATPARIRSARARC